MDLQVKPGIGTFLGVVVALAIFFASPGHGMGRSPESGSTPDSAGQVVPAATPKLIFTIPWKTAEYELPPGKAWSFGPKKLFVSSSGNFYFQFDRGIYSFDKDGDFLHSFSGENSIRAVEFYRDDSFCIVFDVVRRKGNPFVVHLNRNLNEISRKDLGFFEPGESWGLSLKDGEVFFRAKKQKENKKIKSFFLLNDTEKKIRRDRFDHDESNWFKDSSELNKKIQKLTDGKSGAGFDGFLGRFAGAAYYYLRGGTEGRVRMGVAVKNEGSGNWQYLLFPINNGDRNTIGTFLTRPAVSEDGTVFYLSDDESMVGVPKGISVYRWPVHW